MKKCWLKRIISLAIVLTLTLAAASAAATGVDAAETEIPEEVADGTLVWDVENAPEDMNDWAFDFWEGYGVSGGTWSAVTAAGKGVNGSTAIGWEFLDINKDRWAMRTYIDFSNDPNAVTDWTGATELMFYVDGSEVVDNKSDAGDPWPTYTIHVFLNYDGSNELVVGAPVYYYQDGAWVETAVTEWAHIFLENGYVGWVRIPLSSMVTQPEDLSCVTQIGFYVEHLVPDAKVYLDHFTINATPADVPPTTENLTEPSEDPTEPADDPMEPSADATEPQPTDPPAQQPDGGSMDWLWIVLAVVACIGILAAAVMIRKKHEAK